MNTCRVASTVVHLTTCGPPGKNFGPPALCSKIRCLNFGPNAFRFQLYMFSHHFRKIFMTLPIALILAQKSQDPLFLLAYSSDISDPIATLFFFNYLFLFALLLAAPRSLYCFKLTHQKPLKMFTICSNILDLATRKKRQVFLRTIFLVRTVEYIPPSTTIHWYVWYSLV